MIDPLYKQIYAHIIAAFYPFNVFEIWVDYETPFMDKSWMHVHLPELDWHVSIDMDVLATINLPREEIGPWIGNALIEQFQTLRIEPESHIILGEN